MREGVATAGRAGVCARGSGFPGRVEVSIAPRKRAFSSRNRWSSENVERNQRPQDRLLHIGKGTRATSPRAVRCGLVSAAMSVALEIFAVSCTAVLKVFLIAGVGCVARRVGLLDEELTSKMAKLNGSVFLPCLLFVALGRSVTIQHLRNVWLLPLSACVNIGLGAVLGKAMTRVLCTPNEFKGAAVASASFGNSLALPVVLISAVINAGRVGSVVFDEDAQAESMLYMGSYMTTLTLLMWTVGPVWMRGTLTGRESFGKECGRDVELQALNETRDSPSAEISGGNDSVASVALGRNDSAVDITLKLDSEEAKREREHAAYSTGPSFGGARRANNTHDSKFAAILKTAAPACNANVFASLLGIFVGVVPALRHALFDEDGSLFVVQDCASLIAAGAIPQVIIILGASLASGPKHKLCDYQTALGVTSIRLVLLPLFNILLFLVLKNVLPKSWFPTSPAFWLTFLVEGATPTANNMMLQVQMFGSKDAAEGVAALLFWQYAAAPVLLTGAVATFLAIL